jgi:predicted alpha/beta superfamily hydrolase
VGFVHWRSRCSALTLALSAALSCTAGCGRPSASGPDAGTPSDGGPSSGDQGAPLVDGGGDGASNDGVTTLRIHYPAGSHALTLRGNTAPLTWDKGVALTAGANDTYQYTMTLQPSVAQVEMKPLLDDTTWSRGPNYVMRRGETADVYPHFVTVKGTVKQLFSAFHSTLLGNDRVVWVYLPPSYDENPRATFPVAYMHDGRNLFDPQLAFGGNEWKVDETLDGAAEDGTIRELIVIGPEATSDRIYEYTPTSDPAEGKSGGGDLYLRMLVEELKPQVDAQLRTQPGRATTAVIGSSLGGLISVYAGVKHPDTFGLVGALSPSTWWDNTTIIGDVKGMGAARPDRVYVDSGDSGQDNDDVVNTNLLAAAFVQIGYVDGTTLKHVVQAGGQHSEIYWAMRLPGTLSFLFGARQP